MPVATVVVVAPSAIAARLLHGAVTTDATRYACLGDSPTTGDVNQNAAPRLMYDAGSTADPDRSRLDDLDDLVHHFLHLRGGQHARAVQDDLSKREMALRPPHPSQIGPC